MSAGNTTQQIQHCLNRLGGGDAVARDELIETACARLLALTRRMFRGYPGVQRWEDADDILQNASLRLCKALCDVLPRTASEFMGLAALQIRRELIDLARRYSGPQRLGVEHGHKPHDSDSAGPPQAQPADSTYCPDRLAVWAEFHRCVETLRPEDRAVFDLLWYQEITQADAARLLGVSLATVKRRWQSARRQLFDKLGGDLPF